MAKPIGGPVSGAHYPADLAQLRSWFPTDAACADYLDWLRWPDGFKCPHCGSRSAGAEATGRYRCRNCRKQVSVTSGTIFHKTRTPLTVWFEAVWHLTAPKSGVSASHLHRVLPIHSYQTAWAMLGRLRQVMSASESEPLTGTIEVDEAFFDGPRAGVVGRGAAGKTLVAGAVEITEYGWGRARLAVIPDASAASLSSFVQANAAPGSMVVTDAWTSYPKALAGYAHEAINITATRRPAHESLPAVHRLFALAKRTIEGPYQGSGTIEHLPEYLDEFIFRFNRRKSRHRGLVFMRLLHRALAGEPVTYRDLMPVPRAKATPPQGVAGPRSKPGSLTIEAHYRPWRAIPSDQQW